MDVPEDLRYSTDHEWVRLNGTTARVGITDYAQDQLGEIVAVALPEVGEKIAANDAIFEVDSLKSVSDIFAPVNGTVSAINTSLEDAPEKVNDDPYGEGWMFEIELSDTADIETLMTAAAYRELIDG